MKKIKTFGDACVACGTTEKEFNNKLTNYIKAIFLPLLLVVLFVIQNQLFNILLNTLLFVNILVIVK